MDVAAIKASGAQVVALAPCGTAATLEQLKLIEHCAGSLDHLLIAFDQDDAGRKAAARLYDLLGPDGNKANNITWQGAKDPGELVETGRTEDLAAAFHPDNQKPLAVAWAENFIATQNTSGLNYRRAVARKLITRIHEADKNVTEAVLDVVNRKLPDAAPDGYQLVGGAGGLQETPSLRQGSDSTNVEREPGGTHLTLDNGALSLL